MCLTRFSDLFKLLLIFYLFSLMGKVNTAAEYQYKRGGVLFYAGFNGTRDAQAVGDGKARLLKGGGAITADAYDSVRGSALRSGDGIGYLEFSAKGNILPDEGTIEIWIKPGNWSDDDNQHHYFVKGIGAGGLYFQKGANTVSYFGIWNADAKDPGHYNGRDPNMAVRAYSSEQRKDKWQQFFLIWKKGKPLRYYQGFWLNNKWILVDASNPQGPPAPGFGKLEK